MPNIYHPNKEEFANRAKFGNLVPVYREILADMETPVSAFRKIAHGDYSFLLESVEGGERIGRYSFLGSEPFMVLRTKGRKAVIIDKSQENSFDLEDGQDPLHVLKAQLQRFKWVADPDLPKFVGGAVGYIGYDTVRFFEKLPDIATDDLQMDDCVFVFTDTVLMFDHVRRKIRVICNAHVNGDPDLAYEEAICKIDALVNKLRSNCPSDALERNEISNIPFEKRINSNFSPDGFKSAVKKAKEYIAAGDVIQVVLSQRFSTKINAEPFDIYRALRSLNPSPYMFYLSFGEVIQIGASPEILVTVERGKVTVRPIAGTRPRGKTESEDKALEADLLADEKERAEHIMLVDLGRNDIGRVCRYGSVSVDELMVIERYSHVMHIVSNVKGHLKPDRDQFDALRSTFPAGTVSGAPKIRAMEIIEELEPTKRGSYAGAVGYFSYSGDMDTCITIRTIMVKDGIAYVQAGAGIVADSVPENEYQETVNKSRAMLRAIELAESGLE